MMELRPSQFVNRGSVLASGFLMSTGTMGVKEARKRILDLWVPGMQVKKIGDDFLVLLKEPVRVRAERAPGEPLVRRDNLLTALPWSKKEISAAVSGGDCLVFARAGRVQVIPIAELPLESVAEWIDTSSFCITDVISLGLPAEKPAFRDAEFNARQDLPGAPAESPELSRLLAELRTGSSPGVKSRERWRFKDYLRHIWLNLKPGRSKSNAARKTGERPGISLWRRIRSQITANLPRWLFRGKVNASAQERSSPRAVQESGRNRLRGWIRRSGERLVNLTRFSRLVNSRHARYISRMVEMMQSGDLAEGLRHAIPLADAAKMAKTRSFPFRMLRPRSNLSIRPHSGSAQTSLNVGSDLFEYLRNLYRQAVQRLEAQGRIEEAAFVLTELLSKHEEAASFLEKHGRLRLAAELAEAHNLSAVMVIRLWWLAKERHRAIAVALRTGQIQLAIQFLSLSHPREADRLRLTWAERLADSGKFVAAADIIWPVKEEQYFAHRWLKKAIELGGTTRAIALARSAVRFPESFAEVLPQVEALMMDESPELASARVAFVDNLRRETRTRECRLLGRMAVRALLRDVQRGNTVLKPAQLRGYLEYTLDPCLRADVPALQQLKTNNQPAGPARAIEIPVFDAGQKEILDLAFLPDGRMLLALGEAGMLLLSREGKTQTHLNQPAEHLVVSDDGSRVIGVAYRNEITRLVRVDVLTRTATYWCDAEISEYAEDFDGSVWAVANGADVFLIDTLARGFEAVWRVPDMNGNIRTMRRNQEANRLYVVAGNPTKLTLWTYEYPSFVLRSKRDFDHEPSNSELKGIAGDERTISVSEAMMLTEDVRIFEEMSLHSVDGQKVKSIIFHVSTKSAGDRTPLEGEIARGTLRHAAAHDHWLAIPVWRPNSIEVYLLDTRTFESELRLRLLGARAIALRFAGEILLGADDQGRVLALNIRTNQILRDFRV